MLVLNAEVKTSISEERIEAITHDPYLVVIHEHLTICFANDADYQDAYKAGSIVNGAVVVVNLGNGFKQIITKAGSIVVNSAGRAVAVVSVN